ncbi:MAG: hypothetical protein QM687_01215 [Ferruginibacter sp.]
MGKSEFLGRISFINHEKKYAEIEYEGGGKKRSIKGMIDLDTQKKQKEKKLIKKTHHYMVGDMVSFTITEADNGKNVATNITYLYNNALDTLLNKAGLQNSFKGYLKLADGKYFVKEIESYVFFPVQISPWQVLPTEKELNDPVIFSLDHPDKKDKAIAILQKVKYIPEYNTAIKLFKEKAIIDAVIDKITPHGIFLNIVGDKIQAKLPLEGKNPLQPYQAGEKIPVRVSYISHKKIVVERV